MLSYEEHIGVLMQTRLLSFGGDGAYIWKKGRGRSTDRKANAGYEAAAAGRRVRAVPEVVAVWKERRYV